MADVAGMPATEPAQPAKIHNIGSVAEKLRETLASKFKAYPPNLYSEIRQDGQALILLHNDEEGVNLQIMVADLNMNPELAVPVQGSPPPGANGAMGSSETPPEQTPPPATPGNPPASA